MIRLKILFIIMFFLLSSKSNAELSNFEKGKNFFNEKKYDLAKFKFEQDLVFNPKNEDSYLYLAKIFKLKKDDNQEESNLKTVILLIVLVKLIKLVFEYPHSPVFFLHKF